MADLEDVKIRKEARLAARNHVGGMLDTLFPSHKILLANQSYTIPDQPYITVRTLTDGATNNTGLGIKAVQVDIDEFGTRKSYYHVTQRYQVKFHKEGAMDSACDFIGRIADPDFRYTWFTGDFGITAISDVTDSPTSIDYDSSWEEGATITFSINYLFRHVESNSGTVDTVTYNAQTTQGESVFDLNGEATKPNT